jgi:addiction module HigA family antidote
MRRMIRRPTHPGNIIKEDYLLPLSIAIKDMADTLGVSRKTLSKIINERGAITPDMALRLSRALDTTPDFWLNLQKNYDLWHAETASKEWQKVKPFPQSMLHSKSSSYSEQSVQD